MPKKRKKAKVITAIENALKDHFESKVPDVKPPVDAETDQDDAPKTQETDSADAESDVETAAVQLPATLPKEVLALIQRERIFVIERAKGTTKAESCRRAGYNGSPQTLTTSANRLMKKERVTHALAVLQNAMLENVGITLSRSVNELAKIAYVDWEKLVRIKRGKDGEVIYANVFLSDKINALTKLIDHQKGFYKRMEPTDNDPARKPDLHYHLNVHVSDAEIRKRVLERLRDGK